MGAEPCGPSPRRPDKRTRCSTWGSRDGRAFRRGVRRFPSGSCAQPAIRATVVRLFGLCFGFCAPPIRTAHIAQSRSRRPVASGSAASSKPGGGAGRNRTAAGPAPEPPRERGNGNRTRPNPVRATYGLPARPITLQSRPVHLSSDSRTFFVSYSIHAARVPPRFRVVTTSCYAWGYVYATTATAGGRDVRRDAPPGRPRAAPAAPARARRSCHRSVAVVSGTGLGRHPRRGAWTAAGEGGGGVPGPSGVWGEVGSRGGARCRWGA